MKKLFLLCIINFYISSGFAQLIVPHTIYKEFIVEMKGTQQVTLH